MRRKVLKWLHWVALGLLLYFFFVEPDEAPSNASISAKTDALATHAGVGVLLAVLVVIWTMMYWSKGMAGRPGPKLKKNHPWAVTFHVWGHRALYWALPIMMLTGGAAGLLAPYPVQGFGLIPLNFGIGTEGLHELAEEIHEFAFDALTILVIGHMAFHLWRHYLVKDNALRIMAPQALHRWL